VLLPQWVHGLLVFHYQVIHQVAHLGHQHELPGLDAGADDAPLAGLVHVSDGEEGQHEDQEHLREQEVVLRKPVLLVVEEVDGHDLVVSERLQGLERVNEDQANPGSNGGYPDEAEGELLPVLGAPRYVGVVADRLGSVVEVWVAAADVGVHVVANHVLVHPQHAVAHVKVREAEQVVHPGDGGQCEVGTFVEGIHTLHPREERPAEQRPVLAAHPIVP
jgi:hypothetical protein